MVNIIHKLSQMIVCINYKMLEYKTKASKECDICRYWYFLDKNFNYEQYLCNGCNDLMQKATSFDDVAIVSSKGNDYRIHFWYMSKNDAISIMNKKLK